MTLNHKSFGDGKPLVILHGLLGSLDNWVTVSKYLAKKFNYNENYLSTIKPTEYNFPEKSKDLNRRVKTIMKKLFNNHKDSKDSIIISTHQGICNTILKIIEKTGKTKLKNITNKYKYPKGKITKIFDTDKWVFKTISIKLLSLIVF